MKPSLDFPVRQSTTANTFQPEHRSKQVAPCIQKAVDVLQDIQDSLDEKQSEIDRSQGDIKILQRHLENVWNALYKGHVTPPYIPDKPDLNKLALEILNKTKSLVEEIKSLTAQNKDQAEKKKQYKRDKKQLSELLQVDYLTETFRTTATGHLVDDVSLSFDTICKRVEKIKDDMKTKCAVPDHQSMKLQLHLQKTRFEQLWTSLHTDEQNPVTGSSECPNNFDILYEEVCVMVNRIKKELKDRLYDDSEISEQLQQCNKDMMHLWSTLKKPSSLTKCKPPGHMDILSKEIHEQVEHLQQETAKLRLNVADLQDKLEQANLGRQAQERLARLSKIQTSQMTCIYPVVYELSDATRPTKLGERFSELYDLQWTDAFEQLTCSGKNEKDAIQHLYKLLEKCNAFCIETDTYQTSVIQSTLACPLHYIQSSHVFNDIQLPTVESQLMLDLRKRNIEESTKNLQNQFVERNDKQRNVITGNVKVYVDLCVELCWLMHLHSPPLFLDTNADKKMEGRFDTKMFRPYTKSGNHIEFVVWPPLHLHENGPVLNKGVAQGLQ